MAFLARSYWNSSGAFEASVQMCALAQKNLGRRAIGLVLADSRRPPRRPHRPVPAIKRHSHGLHLAVI